LVNGTEKQNRTAILTGTAIMAALVIVFDYTLKYSGMKIPFPWYPNLKFDFTGIPIIMSLFMYGFPSAVTTSIIAGLGIFMRSGNWVSASMKVFAELSTVLGIHLGLNILPRDKKNMNYLSWALGLASRVLIMTAVNLYVLPNIYRVPMEAAIGLLPLIGVFNVVQGLVTIGLGHFLFQAVKTRLPNWSDEKNGGWF
jgi:riboflavin transporter FmnP